MTQALTHFSYHASDRKEIESLKKLDNIIAQMILRRPYEPPTNKSYIHQGKNPITYYKLQQGVDEKYRKYS